MEATDKVIGGAQQGDQARKSPLASKPKSDLDNAETKRPRSVMRTPSDMSQLNSPRSEGILDPIHALSRRSRSNTGSFYLPMLSSTPDVGSSPKTGPLDGTPEMDADDGDEQEFMRQGTPEPENPPDARSSLLQKEAMERARVGGFRGYSDLEAQPGDRPPKPTPLVLSTKTSEDLTKLFSAHQQGFPDLHEASQPRKYSHSSTFGSTAEEGSGDMSGWRRRARAETSSGLSSSSAIANEILFSDHGWDNYNRILQQAQRYPTLPDYLGDYAIGPSRVASYDAYQPTLVNKGVQTDLMASDHTLAMIESHELTMARIEIGRLMAENQLIKLQSYELVRSLGPTLAGSPYSASRDYGFASGTHGLQPPVQNTGMGFGSLQRAFRTHNQSFGLSMSDIPAFAQAAGPDNVGPPDYSSASAFAHPATLWSTTGAVPERSTPQSRPTNVRTDTPTALNQQRMLATLGLLGQERISSASPMSSGSPHTTSMAGSTDSDASRRGATPTSWPSLSEAKGCPVPRRPPLSSTLETPAMSTDSEGPAPETPENTASPTKLIKQILDGRGQEASIVVQQQLKTGSPELKRSIIRAVEQRLLPLSQDRHGNFLVQRAIGVEPEIAWHLKAHFVELAMSQFGCHVVQRVLDEEERLRVAVVEELLTSRLEETLTSRNSVHVWQKMLEINWTHPNFRSTIFAVMNQQMKGKWAQAARQETGSIICQNIFESADVDEKRDCLNEVLNQAEECASNQWGVWVIQHIIEHGADQERQSALNRLLKDSVKLTLSQFGQKAIMSGLKSGEKEFLEKYVDALCNNQATGSAGPGSRRSALVDVALAPQGLQIVTQLLTSVTPELREKIISTVRKNSVFLKGSKTGLKVHQLCERARAFSGY